MSNLRPPPILTTSHSAPNLPTLTTYPQSPSSPSSSSSTASSPTLSPFAPPFYNRPPTPLPPSPSLTSLLRPPFTPSRPTTSDSSDSEGVAKSSRFALGTPRASPRVPTYEYYGFVLYLGGSLAFLLYILWAYLPSSMLHTIGIHYYPNRWWALAIPSFLVMTLVYIYVALASYNTGYLTRPLSAIECVVDSSAQVAAVPVEAEGCVGMGTGVGGGAAGAENEREKERDRDGGGKRRRRRRDKEGSEGGEKRRREWKELWNRGTDAVMDIPVGGVCEILYGEDREESPDESEAEGERGRHLRSSGTDRPSIWARRAYSRR